MSLDHPVLDQVVLGASSAITVGIFFGSSISSHGNGSGFREL